MSIFALGKITTIECVRRFAKIMIQVFGSEYLRAPNEENTKRLVTINENRVWSGMLGCSPLLGCIDLCIEGGRTAQRHATDTILKESPSNNCARCNYVRGLVDLVLHL
jgi:hypothetical protein